MGSRKQVILHQTHNATICIKQCVVVEQSKTGLVIKENAYRDTLNKIIVVVRA